MWTKILAIDQSWLLALNEFANSSKLWQNVFKIFGVYFIYLVPLILVILWFWQASARKVALRAVFAGILSWVVFAQIIGRLIDRPRPFETEGVKEIFFHRPTYSFPSDHAAFLFAVAFSFWLSGYKKLSWVIFALAIVITFSRIALGFHYPSDIIVGAGLGLIVAWFVWLFDRPLNYLYNFLIAIARKLRLA